MIFFKVKDNVYKCRVLDLSKVTLMSYLEILFSDYPNKISEIKSILRDVRDFNRDFISRNSDFGLLLDGRNGMGTSGAIGDLFESCRFLSCLKGKNITILTSHQNFFSNSNFHLVPICSAGGNLLNPLRNIDVATQSFNLNIPFIFPNLGSFFSFFHVSYCGINNLDSLSSGYSGTRYSYRNPIKKYSKFDYSVNFFNKKDFIVKKNVHQLECMQLSANLMGFDMSLILNPFLFYSLPEKEEREIIREIMDLHTKTILVLSITTSARAFRGAKFYPSDKWISVIQRIAEIYKDCFHFYLIPPPEKTGEEYNAYIEILQVIQAFENIVLLNDIDGVEDLSFVGKLFLLKKIAERKGIMLGIDSMFAGHFFPNFGGHSIVISHKNNELSYQFSAPSGLSSSCLIVLPQNNEKACYVDVDDILDAVSFVVSEENLL